MRSGFMNKHRKKTKVERADIAVAHAIAPVRKHPAMKSLGQLSEVADQPPLLTIASLTLVAGALSRSQRLTGAGARMLVTHLLATGIKSAIKHAVVRTRPEVMLKDGKYQAGKGSRDEHDFNSFPSGHTAGAVAVARAIGRDYPGARRPALIAATALAAVQIPRGKHFVSDVVAGALIGLLADALVESALRRLPGIPDEATS